MMAGEKMNILLVDDRAEQRLSLVAVLSELGQNIVEAASGREALRALLHQQFAVILLDVNMPGLDGFETAALIRQRQRSEHTPIIFITAYSDDAHALRGYSLGAVDYILAPVEPQVLRTKVAVFVDLFKKNEEVHRQATVMRRRAEQLHQLAEASHAINSELGIDRMLQIVTDRAAAIIGARQSVTSTAVNLHVVGTRRCVRLADEYAGCHERSMELANIDSQLLTGVASLPRRMTQSEFDDYRIVHRPGAVGDDVPMRGWLAAPLTSHSGYCLGAIHLSDKVGGEFTEDDEAILAQLGQMASIAMENIVYSQEREANRLKDEFLATLSHELRTPLTSILMWTHMLRTGATLDPAVVSRGLEVIERSGKAQGKLIEDLLDVSRIINNKLTVEVHPVDIVKVIDAAIDAVRPTAEAAHVEVRRLLGPSSCQVSADANRLQQIFGNLLSNAVKFTPEGGQVEVYFEEIDGRARVRVSDTGQGIPTDFLPYIFERFRQADSSTARAHGGLGIGLFVVRRLVELHGGTVWAESAGEGKGSTFVVELPFRDGAHASHGAPLAANAGVLSSPPTNGVRLDGVQVLVVDDEDDARECLALALRQYGALVTAAKSAAEAVSAMEEELPQVLICDIGMPGEDGYSLIRRLRARGAARGGGIPAAALTAYARSEDRARALAAGFDLHVPKPVEPGDLASAVRNLLGKTVLRASGRATEQANGRMYDAAK